MRIACLQFAPRVGDIDNNLNRADAVLSRANPEDLDVLVLPELAFTGYNFKSLQDISPFLEPSCAGISSLWARTTALKYNCVVGVGYPEKADVAHKWPTSPEYYNSLIVVNGEGETVANYRKSFLYYTDETWALEGPDGFFEGHIPGLGRCSMGICMDLNPYKFEAPWHAFEFASHVLENQSKLVIMSMAWLTREEGRDFSRMPKEPDMETLTYWVTRLEPLIRTEDEEEIIVVFCNRTGIEDEAVYAGTSTVIGIKDGEVRIYGLLGRGDKELLVVDTDNPPFAKLVYRPDGESAVASQVDQSEDKADETILGLGLETDDLESDSPKPGETSKPTLSSKGVAEQVDFNEGPTIYTTMVDEPKPGERKNKPQSPKIKIPYSPSLAEVAAKLQDDAANGRVPTADGGILTPTGPSPTPQAFRPKFGEPERSTRKNSKEHVDALHPNGRPSNDTRTYGEHELISQERFTPITPFEDATPTSLGYLWMAPDSLLKSPGLRRDWAPALSDSPTPNPKSKSPAIGMRQNSNYKAARHAAIPKDDTPTPSLHLLPACQTISNGIDGHIKTQPDSAPSDQEPAGLSSPKSRNASRTEHIERLDSSVTQRPDFSNPNQQPESLSTRPRLAMVQNEVATSDVEEQAERLAAPKPHDANRSRPWLPAVELIANQRRANISRNSLLVSKSPPIVDTADTPPLVGARDSHIDGAFNTRFGQHSRCGSASGIDLDRPGSRQGASAGVRADRPQSRTTMKSPAPGRIEAMGKGLASRPASRGRQPGPDEFVAGTSDTGRIEPPERSQSRRGLNRAYLVRGRLKDQRPDSKLPQDEVFASEIVRVSPSGRDHASHTLPSHPAADDIVEIEIIRPSPNCPVHGQRQSSSDGQNHNTLSRNSSSPPSDTQQLLGSLPDNMHHKNSSTCPALCGFAVASMKSSKTSLGTPLFEPTTPQPMVLVCEDDDATPNISLSAPFQQPFKVLERHLTIDRPRSAVW